MKPEDVIKVKKRSMKTILRPFLRAVPLYSPASTRARRLKKLFGVVIK